VTVTLDDPNPTLVIPSSGSFTHTFSGTISVVSPFSIDDAELFFPFINCAPPGLLTGNIINFPFAGTYVGDLFTYEINATDTPGFYNEQLGGGLATFTVKASSSRVQASGSAAYSINLVTSVPESSPVFVASILLGIFAVVRSYKLRNVPANAT
jgi:hypothetical protein